MDRSALSLATRPTEEPTPGYIYRDLAAMTYSSPTVCAEMEDFLIKRLGRNDPYLKLKVLKIIKHVSENGCPDFRRRMQRKVEMIKQCLTFKGAPHPVRGDAPSREVREEADRCLKSLFNRENAGDQGVSYNSVKQSGRIQGFGSEGAAPGPKPMAQSGPIGMYSWDDSQGGRVSSLPWGAGTEPSSWGATGSGGIRSTSHHNIPVGSGGGMGMGMSGFGNPRFDHTPHPTRSEALMTNLTQAAVRVLPESVLKRLDDLGVPVSASAGGGTNDRPYSSSPSMVGGNGIDFGGGSSVRGGRRDDPHSSSQWAGRDENHQQGYQNSHVQIALDGGGGPRTPWGSGTIQCSAEKGIFERKVVDDLCLPVGAKVAPPAEALGRFCHQCSNLDLDIVGSILREKLEPGVSNDTGVQSGASGWRQKLRVLYILEALCDFTMSSECVRDGMLSYMSEHMVDPLRTVGVEHSQCRWKAAKLLGLIGEELPLPEPQLQKKSDPTIGKHGKSKGLPGSPVRGGDQSQGVNLLDFEADEQKGEGIDHHASSSSSLGELSGLVSVTTTPSDGCGGSIREDSIREAETRAVRDSKRPSGDLLLELGWDDRPHDDQARQSDATAAVASLVDVGESHTYHGASLAPTQNSLSADRLGGHQPLPSVAQSNVPSSTVLLPSGAQTVSLLQSKQGPDPKLDQLENSLLPFDVRTNLAIQNDASDNPLPQSVEPLYANGGESKVTIQKNDKGATLMSPIFHVESKRHDVPSSTPFPQAFFLRSREASLVSQTMPNDTHPLPGTPTPTTVTGTCTSGSTGVGDSSRTLPNSTQTDAETIVGRLVNGQFSLG